MGLSGGLRRVQSSRGNLDKESGALTWGGFEPDFAVVPVDNAFGDGQAQSMSVLFGFELMECFEDDGLVLRVNSDAVISNRIDTAVISQLSTDDDQAFFTWVLVSYGIVDEIGEKLGYLYAIAVTVGQFIDLDTDFFVPEVPAKRLEDAFDDGIGVEIDQV